MDLDNDFWRCNLMKQLMPMNTIIFNCVTLEMIYLKTEDTINTEYLYKHWFYVPYSFNEKMWFNQLRSNIKSRDFGKPLHRFTIFTTTDCNARCFYCYEKGVRHYSMTKETSFDVASFIAKHFYGQRHKLHWFGGEPLCNMLAIDIISSELTRLHVDFDSIMTSNGYLFDENAVNKAINLWKLKNVQITLDGTKEIYTQVKNYVQTNEDPFEKVLANIELLLNNKISVKIRLNVGLYNVEDIVLLIDLLKNRFGRYPNLFIYPALVDKYRYVYSFDEIQQRNEQFQIVQKHLELSGLHYKRKSIDNTLRLTNCVGDDYRGCVILPNGKLSKCATLMEEEIYGDIYMDSSKYNIERIESWQQRGEEIIQCEECCIYPLCSKRLEKCPSDRKHPIYDYECQAKIFDYISTIRSNGLSLFGSI